MVMLFLCGLFCAAAGGLLSGDHRQHADGRQPSGFVSRARQEQPAVGPHPRRPGALPPEARAGHGGQRSAIYWLFDQFGLAQHTNTSNQIFDRFPFIFQVANNMTRTM